MGRLRPQTGIRSIHFQAHWAPHPLCFPEWLGAGSFLALDRKNIPCYLILVSLGQFYESAPIFKFAVVLLYDANDLSEYSRLWPLL